MKCLILAAAVLFNVNAFASDASSAIFGNLAAKTVKSMYGRKGDYTAAKLVENKTDDTGTNETWEIDLSNVATAGSASYQVTIKQKAGAAKAGEEVASIVVRYLDSN
jgi:hypothetical protein